MAIRTDIFSIDWSVSPRVIWIDIAFSEVSAQDLYDTCKHLEALEGGVDEDVIADAGGWEPLGAGKYVGITVSLFNAKYKFADRPGPDWVICNMTGGNVVAFTDSSKSATLYPREPSAYVSADRTASSAATTQELDAIQFSSFGGCVSLDITSSNTGTAYPNGNLEYPVNNLTDAVAIANSRGFKTLSILSSMTGSNKLDSGTDLTGFTLRGVSSAVTELEIDSSTLTQNVNIKNCNVYGTLDDNCCLLDCLAGTINYINGHIDNCGLYGTITLGGDKEATINNCYTVDQDNPPIINMGGGGQDLAMPNYSGIITITNITSASEECGIGLNSGIVILDPTITAGTFIISGIGTLIDNSTSVSSLNTDGLINKKTIAEAVWDKTLP